MFKSATRAAFAFALLALLILPVAATAAPLDFDRLLDWLRAPLALLEPPSATDKSQAALDPNGTPQEVPEGEGDDPAASQAALDPDGAS